MNMQLKKINIAPEQININIRKLLVLMGVNEEPAPEPYQELIEEEINRISDYPDLQGGYTIIGDVNVDQNTGTIRAGGRLFQAGPQVTRYLEGSEMMAFFTCTAGEAVSLRSKELMSSGQLLEGYIVDLLGSLMADEAMDIIHSSLKEEVKELGLKTTNRYSPGYCDWKVDEQKQLFSLFPENFCGISLGDSCLMHPIKSVSGVIGLGDKVKFHKYICHACSNVECIYRDLKYRV